MTEAGRYDRARHGSDARPSHRNLALTAQPSRLSSRSFAICVTALALALRVSRLDESLWYDEIWATRVKVGTLWDLLVASLNDVHPPGYPLFMFLWTAVVGDSELAVRAIPLIEIGRAH